MVICTQLSAENTTLISYVAPPLTAVDILHVELAHEEISISQSEIKTVLYM